jgi:hypothetical protein
VEEIMDKKVKHLEFIQNVITRMNSNLFMIKGWCITIVSAIFILSERDTNSLFLLFSIIPCISFWLVDGFFISQERKFRALYTDAAKKKEDDIDFSMDTSVYKKGYYTWCAGIFSKTLLPFYGFILIGIISIYLILWYFA